MVPLNPVMKDTSISEHCNWVKEEVVLAFLFFWDHTSR
jgi:hypothetical protein